MSHVKGSLSCYSFSQDIGNPGDWAPWGNWSECSKTCGRGFQQRHRECVPLSRILGPGDCGDQPDSVSRLCDAGDCPPGGCRQHMGTSWHGNASWWRNQMETFSALLAICAGNSPVPGEFPAQRPVTRSFDVFFDLHPNKRLSKQWWGWWFETPSSPLWRHRNVSALLTICFHSQKTSMWNFGVYHYHILFLNKQSSCWWFDTPWRSCIWHCNVEACAKGPSFCIRHLQRLFL